MISKTKILMTSLFAIFMLVAVSGFVSAVVEFDPNLIIQDVNPGSTAIVTFVLQEDGHGDLTDLSIDTPITFLGNGCAETFDADLIISGLPSTLDEDAVSGVVSVAFPISDNQFACTYEGDLTLRGKYVTNVNYNLPLTITVLPEPSISIKTSGTLSENTSASFTVTNEGNVNLNLDLSELSVFGAILSSTSISNLAPGVESASIDVSLPNDIDLDFGESNVRIEVEDTFNSVSATATFVVRESFCKAGSVGGNLEITNVDISNRGEGDDEEWFLLDMIEVEIEVENNGDDDIDDVFIEIGLFDSNGVNQIGDLEFDNADEEEFDVGKIRDGKDETVTFVFQVPADFDDGSYKLAVKAYSDDLKEDVECTDTSDDLDNKDIFTDIDVEREDDEGKFIAFDNIRFVPEQAMCGERVTLTVDVYNIGDEDQEQVQVFLRSTALDIDENIEIRKDLDQGDDETLSFEFAIPQNMEDGLYDLGLSSKYDYRRGTYRQSSDDERIISINIAGCSPVGPSDRVAAINAVLESDANSGEVLIVKATITNLRTESASFVIDALNFQSWATLDDISDEVITLGPGESKDVTFTFTVDEDAEGEESFVIDVRSGAEFEAREIAVTIEGAGGSKGGFGLGDNTYLWIIGIVNVILVVLIVIVAIRISRR